MVVGANGANPNTANTPFAAVRNNETSSWSVVSTSTFGARGLLGVTHFGGSWYATTNAPGGIHAFVGSAADSATPVFTATDTGQTDHLTDIIGFTGTFFLIGTLNNQIIKAALDLSSFVQANANGPGSYTTTGVHGSAGGPYISVGLGSSAQGICESANAITWTLQVASFTTASDNFVTSNTIIFDGTQWVAVGGSLVATSTNATVWSVTSIAAATTTAQCIVFDQIDDIYYVGDRGGNVLVATSVAGIATATPQHISSAPNGLRCGASVNPVTLLGDSNGAVYITQDDGGSWTAENPGLGTVTLTGAAGH